MERFSPLAWIAIALIVIVLIVVNLWMVALLKNKDLRSINLARRMPRSGQTMQDAQKFMKLLRNPWLDEDAQLNELSKRIRDLKDQEPKA